MMKRRIIPPLLVFLLGVVVLSGAVYHQKCAQQEQKQMMASLNAMTYAERMKLDVMNGIGVTDTLEQIVVSENGHIDRFAQVAEDMMTDSIQSIQIAPDGVVTEIYPEAGNEAGKIDLINDPDRGEICRYGRDNHVLTMQGPFQLKQGGYGIAVRNPIYLTGDDGEEYFWGFGIVIIRVPEIFSDSLRALSDFGYDYQLNKEVSPWDNAYKEVYSSGSDMKDVVTYDFEIGGCKWELEVAPNLSATDRQQLYIMCGVGMVIVLLLTGLTPALMVLNEHRRRFQKLAIMDALTGILNRNGFDRQVIRYLKQNPQQNCVGVQFDIDDFKFINDMYGHECGDMALQNLAEGMRTLLPKNAILGRKGGDEFCFFLPDCTCTDVRELLEQFTRAKRSFQYEGEERSFTISLGYAQYPTDAGDHAQLMRCADAALYEIKLKGKNGCLEYQEGQGLEIRTQLGFALKDVSENLPGAFIIYKADKDDDEILFANRELTRLAGCSGIDEFLEYTNRSFRNLIREDEQESVEKSIWEQIGSGHHNDYVWFHLHKADGTYLRVLDHGRIVENGRYGKVFYVLIMDWESMKKHYTDSF